MEKKDAPTNVQITTHNQSGGTNIGVQNNYAPPARTIEPARAAATVELLSKLPQREVQINVSSEDNAENMGLANQLHGLFARAGWQVQRGIWYGHGCSNSGSDIALATQKEAPQPIIDVGKSLAASGLSVFICQGTVDTTEVKLIVLPPKAR